LPFFFYINSKVGFQIEMLSPQLRAGTMQINTIEVAGKLTKKYGDNPKPLITQKASNNIMWWVG
jgi:hypothetical protein